MASYPIPPKNSYRVKEKDTYDHEFSLRQRITLCIGSTALLVVGLFYTTYVILNFSDVSTMDPDQGLGAMCIGPLLVVGGISGLMGLSEGITSEPADEEVKKDCKTDTIDDKFEES